MTAMKNAALVLVALTIGCGAAPESEEEERIGSSQDALSTMTRDAIIARAQTGVGYSYWWAHGRWRLDGAEHGSCSGGCPSSCTHSGSYGADCSGFVGKVWQVPNDIDVSTDSHPYSTWHFVNQQDHWANISRSEVQKGDAFVYNTSGAGHIFLFESGDPWGSAWAYECAGCSSGCVHNIRTVYSNYQAIRRNLLGPAIVDEIVLPMAALGDGSASSDVDGDGSADACVRHSAGFRCVSSGEDSFDATTEDIALTNDLGWDKPQYYGTIRMADINGDRRADVCARGADGIFCWLSDGAKFPYRITGPAWSDANGWGDMKFWSTIRLADIDGDGMADLCGRTVDGIRCHHSTGEGFGEPIDGPALSDANGWGVAMYYGTIRFGDVNGDAMMDVCSRHSAGFSCWLSDGRGFPTEVAGPGLSDANGWGDPKYWATIALGDIDADGKDDVCARHSTGYSCWLADAFTTEIVGPVLSNDLGWDQIQYWSTLRLVDIDGDRRSDLCGRGAQSFHCWLSAGSSFGEIISGPDMGDAQGWNKPEYYATFRVSDASGDGKAEVCGRGAGGIVCWPFEGSAFGEPITGPAWSDENGFANVVYYSTLQLAGGCSPREELCNDRDDDCDGEIDEDCSAGSNVGDKGDPGANGEELAEEDGGCSMSTASMRRTALWPLLLIAPFSRRSTRRRSRANGSPVAPSDAAANGA
jgi:hypothetical protein